MKIKISDLKSESREKLLRRYGTVIGAFLLVRAISMFAISISQSLTGAAGLVYFGMIIVLSLLEGVLVYGDKEIYLDIAKGTNTSAKKVFTAFKTNADRAIGCRFFQIVVLAIALVLIEIPAFIIKTNDTKVIILANIWSVVVLAVVVYIFLMFSQTIYILIDNSETRLIDALKQSAKLMEGKKGKLLLVYISFIPMGILTMLSMMIGSIYFHPYLNQTLAEFYMEARLNG